MYIACYRPILDLTGIVTGRMLFVCLLVLLLSCLNLLRHFQGTEQTRVQVHFVRNGSTVMHVGATSIEHAKLWSENMVFQSSGRRKGQKE